MTNQQAYRRAMQAVKRFMSARDEESGMPIQQDMSSWGVEEYILAGLAYTFKQGPKPYWWDDADE